jgi:hypothetical protein
MNRLFFRDADAAAGATAQTGFTSKMLRSAAPDAQNFNEKKRTGKTVKWNQEEKCRLEMCRRNKLAFDKSHSEIEPSMQSRGRTDKMAATQRLAGPSCLSITDPIGDISYDSASDITSPCSSNSKSSPGETCDEVEIRRNGCDGREWSPIPTHTSACPLASGDPISPELQFSRMCLSEHFDLPSTLDTSVDSVRATENVKFVAETPRHDVRGPALGGDEGCDAYANTEVGVLSLRGDTFAFGEIVENRSVVLETPFKNERTIGRQELQDDDLDSPPSERTNAEVADDEIEIVNAWFQVQAQTLLREFPSDLHVRPETGSLVDVESMSNSKPLDEVETAIGIAPKSQVQTMLKSLDHHGSCNNPVFSFPTLQAALAYYTSHDHNVALLTQHHTPNRPNQACQPHLKL